MVVNIRKPDAGAEAGDLSNFCKICWNITIHMKCISSYISIYINTIT